MLTVINTPQAPEDYSYHVDVPGGGHITLNTDGTASVLDANFQRNRDTRITSSRPAALHRQVAGQFGPRARGGGGSGRSWAA